jgi:polyphosphate glucokinase
MAKRAAKQTKKRTSAKTGPITLAIDIGGTGLKAALLDPMGALIGERVRVDTPYPCPPNKMVATLAALVKPLKGYERISAGFPGVIRKGVVLSAPHYVTQDGPGTKVVPKLVKAWDRYPLANALEEALGRPVRAANDADLQGSAVVRGEGLELVVTLGTGVGTALFLDGHLAPHLELAHHPLHKGDTYNEYLGDAARKDVGNKHWNKRVRDMLETLTALVLPDRIFIGGGNSRHVKGKLPPHVTLVDNVAGLEGGIKLWSIGTP